MSRTQLIGVVTDASGNPLSNGSLTIKLMADAAISGVGQISAGIDTNFTLDSNGSPVNAYLWPTDVMNSGSIVPQYVITAYTALGQIAWGPSQQSLPSGATFDISGWQ